MDYEAELLNETRNAIKSMPNRKEEIIDLYTMAVEEIEGGGSAVHEYELFVGSLDELKENGGESHE